MKKFVKVVVVALTLMFSVSMFMACGIKDPSLDGIIKSGTLVIATSPDFPPFEYKDGKKTVGWDMDIAAEFAKSLDVKLKIVDTDFDGVLAAPAQNKAHIGMAGISYSAERAENVSFTNTVYSSNQVIIVKNDNTSIAKLGDLSGKKVGGQRGTVGFLIADCNEDWKVDEIGTPSEAKAYDTGALAVADLINGKIDAVIIDTLPANNFVKANAGSIKIVKEGTTELSVLEDDYAFIVQKGNDTLVNKLNELLALYKTNGILDTINEKHFGAK